MSIANIISHYVHQSPGLRANLYRILMHGAVGGTGRLVILPVDQGLEHGPDVSFKPNPEAYDPSYHFELAIKAKLSAYAAHYSWLQSCVDRYIGKIPLILKLNANNALNKSQDPEQVLINCPKDAVQLGCSAVGITIYPGSTSFNKSIYEIKEVIKESKSMGLPVVMWAYPRGSSIKSPTAIDISAYSAHIACALGADIIKLKLPTNELNSELSADSSAASDQFSTIESRVAHVMRAAFNYTRLVVFSGGVAKSDQQIIEEARGIRLGGGSGSMIGRNAFQRSAKKALLLLQNICAEYCT